MHSRHNTNKSRQLRDAIHALGKRHMMVVISGRIPRFAKKAHRWIFAGGEKSPLAPRLVFSMFLTTLLSVIQNIYSVLCDESGASCVCNRDVSDFRFDGWSWSFQHKFDF
jgi:hypothetical protein